MGEVGEGVGVSCGAGGVDVVGCVGAEGAVHGRSGQEDVVVVVV